MCTEDHGVDPEKGSSLNNKVCRGTDHYIDDIVVQESVVSAEAVRQHLTRYGLETKEPEVLDGGRLLGVALKKDTRGHLQMSRGTPISEISLEKSGLTKRERERTVLVLWSISWSLPSCRLASTML